MEFVAVSIAIAFCVFVWLRTNAFVEFAGFLFSRQNVFYIHDYEMEPETTRNALRYPLWLYVNHRSVLAKLISCPLCLSFWCNLMIGDTINQKLAGAFISLIAFCALDKLYKHG